MRDGEEDQISLDRINQCYYNLYDKSIISSRYKSSSLATMREEPASQPVVVISDSDIMISAWTSYYSPAPPDGKQIVTNKFI